MQIMMMKTNGGPHPAGKWAIVTAGQIMRSVFGVDNAEAASQRKLELAILDVFEKHHDKVQTHERGKITEHGIDRLTHPLEPAEHIDDTLADFMNACKTVGPIEAARLADDPDVGSRTVDVAAHFAKPEVARQIKLIIGGHTSASMGIERSWHADRNADHPVARAYRAARHEHGPHLAHVHALAAKAAQTS